MADEKELKMDDGGGKKKKLLIIIIAVVVLIGGGVGAFLFLGGSETPDEAALEAAMSSARDNDGEEGEGLSAPPSTGTALYVPMPRPFRFNVPGAARDRFVEIRVQLLIRGSENEEEAKKHIPLIESTLLQVFSLANADDLSTSAGKTSLKQKALVEVQKVMKEISGSQVIEQVLFTGFVMQ